MWAEWKSDEALTPFPSGKWVWGMGWNARVQGELLAPGSCTQAPLTPLLSGKGRQG